jgi:hypothetical protein
MHGTKRSYVPSFTRWVSTPATDRNETRSHGWQHMNPSGNGHDKMQRRVHKVKSDVYDESRNRIEIDSRHYGFGMPANLLFITRCLLRLAGTENAKVNQLTGIGIATATVRASSRRRAYKLGKHTRIALKSRCHEPHQLVMPPQNLNWCALFMSLRKTCIRCAALMGHWPTLTGGVETTTA